MKNTLFLVLTCILFSCQTKSSPNVVNSNKDTSSVEKDLKNNKVDGKKRHAPVVWFDPHKDFEVLNAKRSITESSSAPDTNDCKGWRIKPQDIRKIILHSESLSGPDWHYLFAVYPCIMVGQIQQDCRVYDFEMNAGAWMYIHCKDTTLLLGDFKEEDTRFFIAGPDGGN